MRPTSVESRGGAFGCADGFDLRIHHFQASGTVWIDFHFAVQGEALAFLHTAFEICAVEETRVKRSGAVAKSGVEDRWAAASKADGGASAGGYFGENCVYFAGDNFGNLGEPDAVFVTEWEIAEQVAGGEESAVFENGGTVGADAAKKFYGSCQGDGHGFTVFVRCSLIRVIELQDIYNIFVRAVRRQRAKAGKTRHNAVRGSDLRLEIKSRTERCRAEDRGGIFKSSCGSRRVRRW